VAIIGFFIIFTTLKPRFIAYGTLNHPLLQEFKRCKNLGHTFEFYHLQDIDIGWWLNPHFRGVTFSFLDTVSQHGVEYYYKINVKFQNNEVKEVFFENFMPITGEHSIAELIEEMENDSLLDELIEIVDIEECHIHRYPFSFHVFEYASSENRIHYKPKQGIVYFKLADVPQNLKSLSYYSSFLKMTGDKGFTISDFDSVVFIQPNGPWRIQGFIEECGKDFAEVDNYGGVPVNLKWISNPDTIDPLFLESKISEELRAVGLSEKYLNAQFNLVERGATRDADYYKKANTMHEASRIIGYFEYIWNTGTWIDKLRDGLRIKMYFTYFLDRQDLETVRIGTSTSNFHAQMHLHPVKEIIDFGEIKKKVPGIDTADINFRVDQNGKIWLNCVVEKYRYEVELESGFVKKEPNITIERGFPPSDVHLYSSMEINLYYRRKKDR